MKKKETHGYIHHKTKWGKIWHFLWHEDSLLSYAASIILVLIIGKFLFYPALGATLGTSFPLVAVVSGSMDHHNVGYDNWWQQRGGWYEQYTEISQEQFRDFYRSQGFKKGDVLVIKGTDRDSLQIGNVIVYSVPGRKTPIIHRIVNINEDGTFVTKGDANNGQIGFEHSVSENQIAGKAIFLIPKIGWIRVLFVEIFGF